jgi:hypothetical protein
MPAAVGKGHRVSERHMFARESVQASGECGAGEMRAAPASMGGGWH